MTKELYKRYRPKTLDSVVGQPKAVDFFKAALAKKTLPHTVLLTGPSGVGKTTLARIVSRAVGCEKDDVSEVNCATVDPLEKVRQLERDVNYRGLGGGPRAWILDECQSMSRSGFSMQGLLKVLEDTPDHAYFFLATTDPQKLLPTIRNRCTEVKLSAVQPAAITARVNEVAKAEGVKFEADVVEKIVEMAAGSVRAALVYADKVIGIAKPADQLAMLEKSDDKEDAIRLARALFARGTTMVVVGPILKAIEGEDAEGLRHRVLAYARSILINPKSSAIHKQAFRVLQAFERNFYDSKHAGLAAACYEVVGN